MHFDGGGISRELEINKDTQKQRKWRCTEAENKTQHALFTRRGREKELRLESSLSARLPRRAVGVCCKSSVTDLKSGFLPINIETSKVRTLPPLLLFHTVLAHRPQPRFHFPLRLDPEVRKEGLTKTLKNIEHWVINYCNDAGRDGYRREGKSGRRKLKAGAASTRQDGLLGETREELFMVNLHINDSFLPLMISMLHAENIMCRQLVRMVGNAAIVRVHTCVCVCYRERQK